MNEIKNAETMVQDQNLTPAPETGAEKKDTFNNMEGIDNIPGVQTIGAAIEGEQQAAAVPAPETPAATAAEADPAPESTEEKVDGTTEAPISLEPVTLEKYRIYSMTELVAMGVRLARLADNRDINDGAVKKKMESIKAAGGIISSSLLVPARVCLEQGHKVVMNGEEVTLETPGLDNIYVLVDGQHRDEAVRKLNNESAKEDAEHKKYEDYFNIPLIDNYRVSSLLRETNTATFPWKDRQYLSNLLMLKPEKKLELLNEIQNHPQATTKAALHWLTLDTSRTLYSRNIVAAMLDDKELEVINNVDSDRLQAGKKVLSAAEEALGAALAGTTPFSDWAVEKIINNPKVSAVAMADKLAAFFKWLEEQGRATTYKSLKAQKATDKQVYVAKDTVIRKQLGTDYEAYLESLKK